MILEAVKGLRRFESQQKKKLLVDGNNIQLQFSLFKIPNQIGSTQNLKLVKIVLPHVPADEDVCLFVGDGANKKDRGKIDETIQHYEEKLRELGITQISEVIPLLKLKLEYQSYESKRALATRFDLFLADDKICRYLPSILGKHFYRNKRLPVQVRLADGRIENNVKQALRTKICGISLKGSSSSVSVARLEMEDAQIVENVQSAIAKICEQAPGGELNLQHFNLILDRFPPLPIFISAVDRSVVPVPILPHRQEEEVEMEDVSTIEGKVSVGRDGTITILRRDGNIKQVIGGKPSISSRKRRLDHAENLKASKNEAKEGVPRKRSKKQIQANEGLSANQDTSVSPKPTTQPSIKKTPKATPTKTAHSSVETPGKDERLTKDKTPANKSKTPANTGKTPANAGRTPANAGKTPANAGKIPANAGKTPANAGKIPANAGKTPANAGKTPVAVGKKTPTTKTPTTGKKAPNAIPARPVDGFAENTPAKENTPVTPGKSSMVKKVRKSIAAKPVQMDGGESTPSLKHVKKSANLAPKTPPTAKKMKMMGTPVSKSPAPAKENMQKFATPKTDQAKSPKVAKKSEKKMSKASKTPADPVKKTPPSIRKTRNATKKLVTN